MEKNQNTKNNKIKYIILTSITLILIITITIIITYKITSKNILKNTNQNINNNQKEEQKNNNKTKENKEEQTENKAQQETTNKTAENEPQKPNNQPKQEEKPTPTYNENDVVKYFEEEEKYIINSTQGQEATSRIKSTFQTIYGFLFKEETIKGYKFKDLTTSAKLKILKLSLSIDNKIDKYFPNYKENIKEKCTSLKEKAITEYLEITANICESNQELCKTASKDFNTMKKNYKLGISAIKSIISSGSDKLKNWWANK
ncbi:MAG: hypothetical protein J6B89_03310 [Bacilli bacterium]|nr:hypothetical protein [Bacilli bacterium]